MEGLALDDRLRELDYSRFKDPTYQVSEFALSFVTFIKLVNGGSPENKSPLFHAELIDALDNGKTHTIACCARGSAKTSLLMYMILYIAVFGGLPKFGEVWYMLYVSDTIENGVKSMKQNLEYVVMNSEYLNTVLDIPKCKINQIEWEFCNKAGKYFTCTGFGAGTKIRGTRRYNRRPSILAVDDVISDKNATSDTIIESVLDVIEKAAAYALDPNGFKVIWLGTPFNKKDPLYTSIATGAWEVLTFPICEKFPCSQKEFIGSWEDRFPYSYVKSAYDFAIKNNSIRAFNQEMMLRIISDEDRLVKDSQILWYNRQVLLDTRDRYNFYITTDFATSEKQHADYTVISVWAYSEDRKWYWVDGVVVRQDFGKTLDDLFNFAALYNPMSVGVEISGQQQGFLQVIQKEMVDRNVFFGLASDKKSGEVGIRPNKSKLERFNMVLPLFQQHRIYFPEELKVTKEMVEAMDEIRHVSMDGFKSAHDDFCDTISQLQFMNEFTPSERTVEEVKQPEVPLYSNVFDSDDFEVYSDESNYSSYVV